MKVPVVSKPNPNEAIVQLQKNAIIRRIEALEKMIILTGLKSRLSQRIRISRKGIRNRLKKSRRN